MQSFCTLQNLKKQTSSYDRKWINTPLLKSSPVADPSSLNTLTVMSVANGLLRINTSCTEPLCSSVLYVDWLKFTMGANNNNNSNLLCTSDYYIHAC